MEKFMNIYFFQNQVDSNFCKISGGCKKYTNLENFGSRLLFIESITYSCNFPGISNKIAIVIQRTLYKMMPISCKIRQKNAANICWIPGILVEIYIPWEYHLLQIAKASEKYPQTLPFVAFSFYSWWITFSQLFVKHRQVRGQANNDKNQIILRINMIFYRI